ncbi:MAG: 30S ribosomal protein S2, partial [Patescibacteria group bacterium]|nr:30S ribosomal protein S2 [Patescibacteria group bacterium]
WLGGTLTNWDEIKKRIKYFRKLDEEGTSGEFEKYTKKEQLLKLRELAKLRTNLHGVQEMTELPGAIFVTDVIKEKNAIMEARTKKIPVVAIVDSNADPDLADYIIPGNDDAVRSLELIISYITDSLGGPRPKKAKEEKPEKKKDLRDGMRKL